MESCMLTIQRLNIIYIKLKFKHAGGFIMVKGYFSWYGIRHIRENA